MSYSEHVAESVGERGKIIKLCYYVLMMYLVSSNVYNMCWFYFDIWF